MPSITNRFLDLLLGCTIVMLFVPQLLIGLGLISAVLLPITLASLLLKRGQTA